MQTAAINAGSEGHASAFDPSHRHPSKKNGPIHRCFPIWTVTSKTYATLLTNKKSHKNNIICQSSFNRLRKNVNDFRFRRDCTCTQAVWVACVRFKCVCTGG